jgi:hypothetical protein
LHHTAALIWLLRFPDEALEAIRYQHDQKAYKLTSAALTREWDLDRADRAKKPRRGIPPGVELLDSVEKLVERAGMPHAYVAYLVESAFVHPSALGADVYLSPHEGQLPVALRQESGFPSTPLRGAAILAIQGTLSLADLTNDPAIQALADEASERLGEHVTHLDY